MPNLRLMPRLFGLLLATALAAGCASGRPPASTSPASARGGVTNAVTGAERQRWLEMFARAYFPGRSGQVFIVPRQGHVITSRGPYPFMHGSPWEYDVHIPLLLYGPGQIVPGDYTQSAVQQDVAPTLASIIGAYRPPTMAGRVLMEALAPNAPRPRLVVLMVFDGMRADYFDKYADVMPTLTRLRRDGAWFRNTRINYLPTLTSIGHATIGTGADPSVHGLVVNNLFNRVTGKPQETYLDLNPDEMMALTLADVWNLTTDGRAIIVGQGGAIRATAGLLGHGACIVSGRKVMASSYSTRDAGWETNPDCYRLPDYLKAINGRPFWEEAGGTWMGHQINNPPAFRSSSLFQRFEGEALAAVATNEAFGADDVTDLLFVNTKGPDYVGHAYGPDSPEIKVEMEELDRQVARLLDILTAKAGPNGLVVAITADHGMPMEPEQGRRHYITDIAARIHGAFDPDDKKVITYYGDAANSQVFIDTERLRTRGFSLKDITTMLEGEPYVAAAFTEEEVQHARRALPATSASSGVPAAP